MTQKIVKAAARIARGSAERLSLGNIAIQRDWGWAPDYVEAMCRMLSAATPDGDVIATGRTVSLEYFASKVFQYFGLNWQSCVDVDAALLRPTDIPVGRANPRKAQQGLGWSHGHDVDAVIASLCEAELVLS